MSLREALIKKNARISKQRFSQQYEKVRERNRSSDEQSLEVRTFGDSECKWMPIHIHAGRGWGKTALGILYGSPFPKSYSQAEVDAMNSIHKEALEKQHEKLLCAEAERDALIVELEATKKELESAKKSENNAVAELEEFKIATSYFLADFNTPLDNLMPDDLEYGLSVFEKEIEDAADFADNVGDSELAGFVQIYPLCKKLGLEELKDFSPVRQMKIFIKDLARKLPSLEQKVVTLTKHNSELKEIIDVLTEESVGYKKLLEAKVREHNSLSIEFFRVLQENNQKDLEIKELIDELQ